MAEPVTQHVSLRKKIDGTNQATAMLKMWVKVPGFEKRFTQLTITGVGNAAGELEAIKNALSNAHHLLYLYRVDVEDSV